MKNNILKPIFLALILISIFGVSSAFAQTPDSVVKELYKIHDQDLKGNNDCILNRKSRKNLDKFFDKTLADFIWKDLTSNSDEVGVLDFDPFYNAQDFQITNFLVGSPKISGGKASVVVKFANAGRRESLSYQLVQYKKSWKIADIKYSSGSSLLGYFKEDVKQQQ